MFSALVLIAIVLGATFDRGPVGGFLKLCGIVVAIVIFIAETGVWVH